MKDYEHIDLNRAIELTNIDAKRQLKDHMDAVGKSPLFGWSQEKHDNYHIKHANEARNAVRYLSVRMMQINPD